MRRLLTEAARALLCLAALSAGAASGGGRIEVGPGDDWFAVLAGDGLRAGDELVLRPGTYADRRLLTLRHRGAPGRPVVIRAGAGGEVVFHRPDARQNSLNLVGASHLVLRGFEITGGSAGIRISADGAGTVEGIVLEDLHIHHTGGAAVTCNHEGSHYRNMIFRRNHIHHTGGHGEGFYLGCNNRPDGTAPGTFAESLIEANHIHDLRGGTVSQGDGIEIKDGSFGNIVRGNVIHGTNYPAVTVYGTDGGAPNVIERNLIWDTGDHGIQAAADAVVRNNLIAGPGGDAIHCRSHQSARPGNLQLVHNTLVAPDTGIRIQRPEGGFTGPVIVANNAVFAPRALRVPVGEAVRIAANAGAGRSEAALAGDAWRGDIPFEQRDLAAGRGLAGAAHPGFPAGPDLDGSPRPPDGPDIGALEFAGDTPPPFRPRLRPRRPGPED